MHKWAEINSSYVPFGSEGFPGWVWFESRMCREWLHLCEVWGRITGDTTVVQGIGDIPVGCYGHCLIMLHLQAESDLQRKLFALGTSGCGYDLTLKTVIAINSIRTTPDTI